jgi:hypothetical protein
MRTIRFFFPFFCSWENGVEISNGMHSLGKIEHGRWEIGHMMELSWKMNETLGKLGKIKGRQHGYKGL